jgi:hypothetical protein
MTGWRQAAIGLASVCAVGCTSREVTSTTRPPAISFAATSVAAGRTTQGHPLRAVFSVKNGGDLTLTIDKLRTGCGCAATPSASALAPSAEAQIDLRCETAGLAGPLTRTVTVYSNDPAQPFTTLTLTGEVEAAVFAEPPALYAGRVRRGREVAGEVRVVAHDPTATFTATSRDQTLAPTLLGKGPVARLRLSVPPQAPLGRFETQVSVQATGAASPRSSIPVIGTVIGDVTTSPSRVRFGLVQDTHAASRAFAVKNEGRTPMHVTAVSAPSALVSTELKAIKDGWEYHVVMKLAPDLLAGRFHGNVELQTDHPEHPRILVPFSGRVGKR